MAERKTTEREAYIVRAAKQAAVEIGQLHAKGEPICDIAYLQGAIREAAMEFDQRERSGG